MANDNSDLWPPDLVVDVLSPIMILNEQAEALTKRTQGIVKGEVLPGVAGKLKQVSFDLVAPALRIRQRILHVRYREEFPYPAVLIAGPLSRGSITFDPKSADHADPTEWMLSGDEQHQARLAHTPSDVRELLKVVFNAPSNRATLFSLVARSNEVTGTVRGESEPKQHDASKPEDVELPH